METWSSKLPKALAKQHRSNMRLVVWNHVITWSCRGLFVYILRYAELVFNLPLHSLASAPRGRMASGARSCEARVMQEPSCEGLRQPERPKGPRQPHPPTQRLIGKWRALMWGTRHAGALLWGAPAARTTNGATTTTPSYPEVDRQVARAHVRHASCRSPPVRGSGSQNDQKQPHPPTVRYGNGNLDNTGRTTSMPPQVRWRTPSHVFIYFLFFYSTNKLLLDYTYEREWEPGRH